MAVEVIMPALEMAQETGRLVRWLKAEGDEVRKGEPVMEIETDKVTVEIEAPADGTLGGVRASEGDEIPVGEPVAYVLGPGESAPERAAAAREPESVAQSHKRESDGGVATATEERPRRRLASPKARRMARELEIDLAAVAGSGPHGAVVAADLEGRKRAEGELVAQSHKVPAAGGDGLAVGAVWRRMAERTAASWREAPHFFLLRDVDATRLNGWRDTVRARAGYEHVTHTDLLVKLCAEALREHPRVNASWREGTILTNDEVNVGVAVATDDGLVVPVVHGADGLGLDAIAARRAELVEAARAGRLRPEDVSGGTFTISNLGMYGVDAFMAIVNAPQAAILAVGRIADRVVPVDGTPAVRPTMTLGLSFDHRVVDGARGARFLDTLAGLVEEPAALVR